MLFAQTKTFCKRLREVFLVSFPQNEAKGYCIVLLRQAAKSSNPKRHELR